MSEAEGNGQPTGERLGPAPWRRAVIGYLALVLAGNLIWEVVQIPLYSFRGAGTMGEIAFDVLHCTGGDVVIAAIAALVSLSIVGDARWPLSSRRKVAFFAIAIGLAYTVFSEWFNIGIRGSWAYSDLMPVIPGLGVGLSPLAQWLIVPGLAMWQVSRRWRNAEP